MELVKILLDTETLNSIKLTSREYQQNKKNSGFC